MKPPNGPRVLQHLRADGTDDVGVTSGVVIDDTGLRGPMGRMDYVPGPPDLYARPAPPTPELWIRFDSATHGVARVGGEILPFRY